jgi:hypothetical protein
VISEQMTDEQREDAHAFRLLKADSRMWPALQRLVRRIHDDGMRKYANTEGLKKSWFTGYREAVDAILPTMEQGAQDAETAEQEDEHAAEMVRTEPADGMGSGDLAIG